MRKVCLSEENRVRSNLQFFAHCHNRVVLFRDTDNAYIAALHFEAHTVKNVVYSRVFRNFSTAVLRIR